jgi:protein arginine N-methyltransferase 2
MGWEDPIMKDAAFLICHNKGKILNVGFGLGLIDTYIQSHQVQEHWIIEAHPDVQNKMKNDGWGKKSNVTCLFNKWQNVYDELPKFDGIYFDTWKESLDLFHKIVPNLLKPGGKYTYWSPNDLEVHSVFKTNEYKVENGITKLDHISSNQKYYNTSKDLFNYKLITKKL